MRVLDEVGRATVPHAGRRLTLIVLWAEILKGQPVARVHDRLQWADAATMAQLAFAPADVPIVESVRAAIFPG